VFTLGGRTAKDLGLIMLRSAQRPVLPGTRDSSVSVPGRPGAYDFGGELGPREFELECGIIAANRGELQNIVRNLAAHLLDSRGRPRTMELIFDIEPDRHCTVRYSGDLPIERIIRTGRLTLPLIAHDPFAYDNDETVFDQVMNDEDILTATGSGNIAAMPVVEITALEATSGIIMNVGLGEIRYLKTLQAGEVLTVDAMRYQATVNGANALNDVDTDWPVLYPGDNLVTYRGSVAARVTITHRGRWT